ncbi:CoA transferase, partial [Glutamicibacter halophytocola]|uniref:CoA transferase n=1 Tax=Glutamicibacter halophytocola TaxID=1933880 RepID=UPI001558A0FC
DQGAYGESRTRTGGRMEGIAPSNAYLCADGASIVVAGNGDGIYRRYMEAIGRPDLAGDESLKSNAQRWEQREMLDEAIGAWSSTVDSTAALEILDAAGVPAGPIYTAEDIVNEPQYQARNMIQNFSVSTGEEILPEVGFPGIVPVMGSASLPIRSLGPDLGEHTGEILGTLLGYSPEEIINATNSETSQA